MEGNISLDVNHIKSAYKKLKSYLYYDNTLIFLKKDIAEFEVKHNLEEKFNEIKEVVEGKNNILLFEWLKNISYYVVPKKFEVNEDQKVNVIKNLYYDNELVISKFNLFIRMPIELHIIDILWIMFIGEKLDKQLKSNIYGYRLVREDGEFKKNSYKLFHKYYDMYKSFRDNAVEEAINLHKQKKSVSFLNLDIKEFFYNISVDFDYLLDEVKDELLINIELVKKLNNILQQIHINYHEKLSKANIYINKENQNIETYLPIGLLSSSIIANYSLKTLDEFILYKIQPQFYGRYVDDILLVINREISDIYNDFFKLFIYFNNKNHTINFKLKGNKIKNKKSKFNKNLNIIINVSKNKKNIFVLQQDKVKLFYFNKNYSIAILKKFKKQIDEYSSIIKDLPESSSLFDRLEESTISISYESTINKISSIKETKIDKLNLSLNLTYIIKLLLLTYNYNNNIKKDLINATNEQLRTIFYGKNIFELHQYWEKVFVYYLVSKSYKDLNYFICNIQKRINDLKVKNNKTFVDYIKNFFKEYLKTTLSLALATNFHILKEKLLKYKFDCKNLNFTEVIKYSEFFSKTNLFKQNFTIFPLLNYLVENLYEEYNIDKYDNKIFINMCNFTNIEFDKHKIEYSPRFIRYDEFIFYQQLTNINKSNKKESIIENALTDYFNKNKFNKENESFKSSYPKVKHKIIIIN